MGRRAGFLKICFERFMLFHCRLLGSRSNLMPDLEEKTRFEKVCSNKNATSSLSLTVRVVLLDCS